MVSLSKLNPANNQEVFDYVVEKLYLQGKQSIEISDDLYEKSVCVYRAKDGCKCAVGQLIPYDMYTAKMEGHTIYGLIGNEIEDKKLKKVADYIKKFNIELLNLLQQAHDRSFTTVEMFFDDILDRSKLFKELNVDIDIVHKLKAEYNDTKL